MQLAEGLERVYVTYKRSCTYEKGWGRRTFDRRNLTYSEALQCCANFNDNRNARQIRNGTKMEFTHVKHL